MISQPARRTGQTPKLSRRIENLLEGIVNADPELFGERAVIVTEAYKQSGKEGHEIRQAKALAKILNEYPVVIRNGELVVGSKTRKPFGSPVYPEISYEWLESELPNLSRRNEQPFRVSEEVKKTLQERVFPYWKGKTVYTRLLEALPKEVLGAHEAGMLFHYYLDRSIGHLTVDYQKVIEKGLNGIRKEIDDELERADYHSQDGNLLEAGVTCIDATIDFSGRYAAEAKRLAIEERDVRRKEELLMISGICEWVPANPARTFWEALQSFFLIHLVLGLESNAYAISPGRFDQYTYPFYKRDIDTGRITRQFAKELLRCLWIKLNELTVLKSGSTAKESTTYNDFQNLNTGGVNPDGEDSANELSYLLLEVAGELRLPQPNLTALISRKTPQSFLLKSIEVVRLGFGQPALVNDDMKVLQLVDKGIPLEDARRAAINGCVEPAVPGKHNMASGGYLNLAKCLELALNSGKDMSTGRQLGPQTGDPTTFASYEQLWEAFLTHLERFIELKVAYDNIARRVYGIYFPVPFTSMLVEDCIRKHRSFHNYGALYNTPLVCPVGIATCADSLAGIKKLIFEERSLSMGELVRIIKSDYDGEEGKFTRLMLLNRAPKYGNDDDYADSIARDLVTTLCDIVRGHHDATGSPYALNIIPTTTHVYFGSRTAATPDGRKSGAPLSEGVSPTQGKDLNGPTSVIKSVTKLPLCRCYGALLNQMFNPTVLNGEDGINKFAQLWRTYFSLGGYHAQFNIISADTLREAQRNPEEYRHLIVRVAGYSDYFVRLSKDVQDEILARTEQGQG